VSRVAILGTATADQVFRSATQFASAGTIAVRRVTPARAGGAPVYTGAALALGGHTALPVFDLGDDADGAMVVEACLQAGMSTEAIGVGGRTPACLLMYASDGRDLCLFDPGELGDRLSDAQMAAIARADLVVISAAAASRVAQVMDRLRPDQRLAWIFKHDPQCFPDPVCRRLMQRADIIFHNRAEAAAIEAWASLARPDALRIQTLGGDGVRVGRGGDMFDLPAEPLLLTDPTGAGDTFAGHMLAELLDGTDPVDAARKAIGAAARFLIDDGRCAPADQVVSS
jgi:ribokinase